MLLNVLPLPGEADAIINAEAAETVIATWQQVHPTGIFSILYGRHVFDTILSHDECAAIKIYNGRNERQQQAFVFVGVTEEGDLPENAIYFDLGVPCPPFCGTDWPKRSYLVRQPVSVNMQQIGTRISAEKAQQMTQAADSFLLGREMTTALLDIPGCAGIIFYNGVDADGAHILVAVPADAAGMCIVHDKIMSICKAH